MPPKVKITKHEIIKTAVELVRENGEQSINARAIALNLNCSTQPIFSNFSCMEQLKLEVKAVAYQTYLDFIASEISGGRYPHYKAMGMAYINFALREKQLFKLLFMCDRQGEKLTPTKDFEDAVQLIMNANGVSYEKASLIHFETWACVHGIATMLATSFLSLEENFISDVLTDAYQGIRAKHLSEEG